MHWRWLNTIGEGILQSEEGYFGLNEGFMKSEVDFSCIGRGPKHGKRVL